MANVVEWVQCKKCGRRHRWVAELAGTTIRCGCGGTVAIPALEPDLADTGKFDPNETLVDPSLTNEAAAITAAPPKLGDDLEIEDEPSKGGSVAGRKAKVGASPSVGVYGDTPIIMRGHRGLFGMSRGQEVVFWGGMVAVAFAMVVHALIVQTWWYITLSVVLVPIALWKFIPARRMWQGNRSFKRAWAETFAHEPESGEQRTDGK